MLERAIRLVVFVTGDVGLRVGSDDRTVALDKRLHVPPMTLVVEQCVADAEPDPEPAGLVEQRLRLHVGHRSLVPLIRLGDVVDEPTGEEGGQGELRVDHQLDAVPGRVVEQIDHTGNDLLAGVVALHRPELRRSDGEHS